MFFVGMRNQMASKADTSPQFSVSGGEPPNKEVLEEAYHAPIRQLAPSWQQAQKKACRFGHFWTNVITMLSSYFAAWTYVNTKKMASDRISLITLMIQNHFR